MGNLGYNLLKLMPPATAGPSHSGFRLNPLSGTAYLCIPCRRMKVDGRVTRRVLRGYVSPGASMPVSCGGPGRWGNKPPGTIKGYDLLTEPHKIWHERVGQGETQTAFRFPISSGLENSFRPRSINLCKRRLPTCRVWDLSVSVFWREHC